MNVGQYQIIGMSKFTNDAGRTATTLHMVTPFEGWEMERAKTVGNKVVSEYTYNEVNCKVNDIVEIEWRKGFQGRAVLSSVRVVSEVK